MKSGIQFFRWTRDLWVVWPWMDTVTDGVSSEVMGLEHRHQIIWMISINGWRWFWLQPPTLILNVMFILSMELSIQVGNSWLLMPQFKVCYLTLLSFDVNDRWIKQTVRVQWTDQWFIFTQKHETWWRPLFSLPTCAEEHHNNLALRSCKRSAASGGRRSVCSNILV